MNKNIYLSFLIGFFVMLLIMPQGSSFFTKSHSYWILKALNDEPDSMVAKLCSSNPEWLIDSNTAADSTILHYLDSEKIQSYKFMHQRNSYLKCQDEAGSDVEKRCKCFGMGSHPVQDNPAHNANGLVPKYITRYLSSNLIGHMRIEDSYDIKHMKLVKNDNVVTSGDLDFYDSKVLDSILDDPETIQLYSDLSGLSFEEFERDLNVFAAGYRGDGFYSTVYKGNVQLPAIFWIISIGLLLVGLVSSLVVIFIPGSRWKFMLILVLLLIAFVGIMLIVSLFTGDTWSWVRLTLKVIPIEVTQSDVIKYNNLVLEDTKEFFRTGVMLVDDASGLDHIDRNGNAVKGALNQAETPFYFFLFFGIIPFFILLMTFLLYKTYSNQSNKTLNKVMNFIGWIIGGIILFLVLFDVILIIINNI